MGSTQTDKAENGHHDNDCANDVDDLVHGIFLWLMLRRAQADAQGAAALMVARGPVDVRRQAPCEDLAGSRKVPGGSGIFVHGVATRNTRQFPCCDTVIPTLQTCDTRY